MATLRAATRGRHDMMGIRSSALSRGRSQRGRYRQQLADPRVPGRERAGRGCVHAALDAGISTLDTADTTAESVLGEAARRPQWV